MLQEMQVLPVFLSLRKHGCRDFAGRKRNASAFPKWKGRAKAPGLCTPVPDYLQPDYSD
jgi:hypothetical protein